MNHGHPHGEPHQPDVAVHATHSNHNNAGHAVHQAHSIPSEHTVPEPAAHPSHHAAVDHHASTHHGHASTQLAHAAHSTGNVIIHPNHHSVIVSAEPHGHHSTLAVGHHDTTSHHPHGAHQTHHTHGVEQVITHHHETYHHEHHEGHHHPDQLAGPHHPEHHAHHGGHHPEDTQQPDHVIEHRNYLDRPAISRRPDHPAHHKGHDPDHPGGPQYSGHAVHYGVHHPEHPGALHHSEHEVHHAAQPQNHHDHLAADHEGYSGDLHPEHSPHHGDSPPQRRSGHQLPDHEVHRSHAGVPHPNHDIHHAEHHSQPHVIDRTGYSPSYPDQTSSHPVHYNSYPGEPEHLGVSGHPGTPGYPAGPRSKGHPAEHYPSFHPSGHHSQPTYGATSAYAGHHSIRIREQYQGHQVPKAHHTHGSYSPEPVHDHVLHPVSYHSAYGDPHTNRHTSQASAYHYPNHAAGHHTHSSLPVHYSSPGGNADVYNHPHHGTEQQGHVPQQYHTAYSAPHTGAHPPRPTDLGRPWTPTYNNISARSLYAANSNRSPSPLCTRRWSAGFESSPRQGIGELHESLELEQSRRRHCERMIANIQATLLEANEEISALTEQSRRRESLLYDKEEKIKALRMEHSNIESFLRNSLEESGNKYRCLVTACEQDRTDRRSAELIYTDKINELENRVRALKDEVNGLKSRLYELEADRNRLICTMSAAEQELKRVRYSAQEECLLMENLRRDDKKRTDELSCELDSLKKYGEHQERKCRDLEERLTRIQTQLDNVLRCKDSTERELAEQAAKQQITLCEVTRSLRTEYEAKLVEAEKQSHREIEKLSCLPCRPNDYDVECIRDEIRNEYEEKIAKLKVDYKLKENNFERQQHRMLDKMREYECRLEGIIKDKQKETLSLSKPCRSSASPIRSDWKDTYRKYTDNKLMNDYGARVRDFALGCE